MTGPSGRFLYDGRLHLQHGPIDLIVTADGPPDAVRAAYSAASDRFPDILPGLCRELAVLRRGVDDDGPALHGPVARRMLAACRPHRAVFVTPMAAVAGAVADEVLSAMTAVAALDRASVNNGGDIALHLGPGTSFRVGVADAAGSWSDVALDGGFVVRHDWPVRGVATSGWRGRSQSLGIADSVTVLAGDAAAADAAATLVANAVMVDHPAVRRAPASLVKDDSDLGDRLVTVDVGRLPDAAVRQALGAGTAAAEGMRAAGLIWGAVLRLQGRFAVVGPPPALPALSESGKGRDAA